MQVKTPVGTEPISVALCTYNGAAYLSDQLQSILDQTYPVTEIVVVDDGSGDETLAILRSFSDAYPLIKIYKNHVQLGAIKNFEKALSLTRYDLIAIADQDDVWHPQKIEKMMTAWPPDVPLVYCDSVRFSGTPNFNLKANPRYARFYGENGKELMMFNTVSGHAVMIRRVLLTLALPFEEGVMYDWWLAMTAAYNGGVVYVPEVLVLQRVHQNNLTVNEGNTHRSEKGRKGYKEMLLPHLSKFVSTPGMTPGDKRVAGQLFLLTKNAVKPGWSLKLFLFLFRYRHQFFYFQKKRLPFF
jgi:glycosyltransferase involved in cell wall biosynthesis